MRFGRTYSGNVSTDDEMSELAASFDRAADVYERSRPSYPAEAVDWLLPSNARTVLDLGAGTGKLTRELVARGLETIAVDPSPKMLAQLTSISPQVRALEGTGESIPLPDASVDAVIAAQAWHWMDPDAAALEVARVLTPGGRLGLVWNVRDDREPWIARLGEIINDGPSAELLEHPPRVGAPFGQLESTVIDWSMQLSRQQLHELVASRSFFITQPEAEQRWVLGTIDRLLDTEPATSGLEQLTVPYRTLCFRCDIA